MYNVQKAKAVVLSTWCLVILSLLLSACQPQRPQIPTSRNPSTPVKQAESVIQLVETNAELAAAADRSLRCYIDSGYALHEQGFYLKHQSTAQQGTYTLNGVYLDTAIVLPVMKEWQEEDEPEGHWSLILPYYLAFGSTGNGTTIPPFANIRIELTIDRD